MKKKCSQLRLHSTEIIGKQKTISIVLLFICIVLVGCTNANNVQPIKDLQILNDKTEIIDNADVNGIDSPLKLTFFKDRIKIRSLNQNVQEQKQQGKTYYYLPVTKEQLLERLPKNRKINNCQFDSQDIKNGKKIPKNIRNMINHIKKSKNKEFILLSPAKYNSLEEFEKKAPDNNLDSQGYTIWEVSKKDRTLTIVHLEQSSNDPDYKPITISF